MMIASSTQKANVASDRTRDGRHGQHHGTFLFLTLTPTVRVTDVIANRPLNNH